MPPALERDQDAPAALGPLAGSVLRVEMLQDPVEPVEAVVADDEAARAPLAVPVAASIDGSDRARSVATLVAVALVLADTRLPVP